jgi:hypothetical protein
MEWTQRQYDDLIRRMDHHHELLHNLIERQADQNAMLDDVQERIIAMSAITDRLAASVVNLTTAAGSAEGLLTSLAQLVRDNVNDPVALAKIADDVDANAKGLADAVVANTPAASEPPPADVPPATDANGNPV